MPRALAPAESGALSHPQALGPRAELVAFQTQPELRQAAEALEAVRQGNSPGAAWVGALWRRDEAGRSAGSPGVVWVGRFGAKKRQGTARFFAR